MPSLPTQARHSLTNTCYAQPTSRCYIYSGQQLSATMNTQIPPPRNTCSTSANKYMPCRSALANTHMEAKAKEYMCATNKLYMQCLSQRPHAMPQPTATWMPQPMNARVPETRNTCDASAKRYVLCPGRPPHGCRSP